MQTDKTDDKSEYSALHKPPLLGNDNMESSSIVLIFQRCIECPRSGILQNLLEENATEHVNFKQQISTDWVTLETTVKPSNEFIDMLNTKLAALHPLSFVVIQLAI
jgi:hypothetical protein